MKKCSLVALLLVFNFGLLLPQTKLDLKTRFADKFEMKGIKHGVLFYLERLGYQVIEFGEDYCVWLEKIEEKRIEADRYEITMRIRITRPSLLMDRPTLKSKDLAFVYEFKPETMSTDEPFWIFIREQIKDIEKKDEVRAFYVGQEVAKEIATMLQ